MLPTTAPTTAQPHGSPAGPRLTGVSFRQMWTTFLERQRHLDEGSATLYAGYGEHHLLPFFGDTDIALIQRTRPLRAADVVPGGLYVEDDWLKVMAATPKRDDQGRPRPGTLLSYKFIKNVLTVLGQCFELALEERPPLLDSTPPAASGCPSRTAGRCTSSTTPRPTPRCGAPCTTTSGRWSAPAPATARPPACWSATCTWTTIGPTSTSGSR
jgi:hypothetical protein